MGEIRIVGSGEARGYPYPVCQKKKACLRSTGVKIYKFLSTLKSPFVKKRQ